jgi:pilus retraction protein PilT
MVSAWPVDPWTKAAHIAPATTSTAADPKARMRERGVTRPRYRCKSVVDHRYLGCGPGRSPGLKAGAASADYRCMFDGSVFDVDQALTRVIELEGSDLHLKVPSPPLIRRNGELEPIPDSEPLKPDVTEQVLFRILTDEGKLEEFRQQHEVDFSYSLPGVARFRVNAFRQLGSISLVCRAIPLVVRSAAELLLPQVVSELAREERGIILLTGTTGSGKSTTLAAMIDQINSTRAKHIVTIEDPVEYRLLGVNQIGVHRKAGLTFATGLRSVLRADPDVIMVGEVRDSETARIAIEAALTGHMVLTTLHTNDAPGAVTRLQEMGIESFLTSSAVECIVAQRLARVLCSHCKKRVVIPQASLTESGFRVGTDLEAYEALGCPRCHGSGYRGRLGIYSVMVLSERIKEMVVSMTPEAEIAAVAMQEGMLTLRQSGLEKVRAGMTSIEEVARVAS